MSSTTTTTTTVTNTIPNSQPNSTVQNGSIPSKDFSDFMLSEYEHISTAHFESGKQLSSFFRYYLLIVSAPAFIFVLFSKDGTKMEEALTKFKLDIYLFTGTLFLIVALIGLLVFVYLVNKEFTSTLYARTVNGIRHYFTTHSQSSNISNFLVLPVDIQKPKYFQITFLLSLVLSFSIINSCYIYLGLMFINVHANPWVHALAYLILHLVIYISWSVRKK